MQLPLFMIGHVRGLLVMGGVVGGCLVRVLQKGQDWITLVTMEMITLNNLSFIKIHLTIYITFVLFLNSNVFADDTRQAVYIMGGIKENYYWNDAETSNEKTEFYLSDEIPASVGLGYVYDYCLFEYQLNNQNHDAKILLSNDSFLWKNSGSYHKGKILTTDDSVDEGPGWDETYDNKKFKNINHIWLESQIGYVFTFQNRILVPYSYRFVHYQNKDQRNGVSIGLIPNLCYSYSSLDSDVSIISSSEQEYYESYSGNYRGDKQSSVSLDTDAAVSFAVNGFYIGFGLNYSIVTYYSCTIDFGEKKEKLSELRWNNSLGRKTSLILGFTGNNFFTSLIFDQTKINEYSFESDGDVSLTDYMQSIELKAGYRF